MIISLCTFRDVGPTVAMKWDSCNIYLHQLSKIKFGSLQDLDFANENILQWVDAWSCLLNLSANHLRDELPHQLFQITWWGLGCHNLPHLATDLTIEKTSIRILFLHNCKVKQITKVWTWKEFKLNLTNLTGLGIRGLLGLVLTLLCESNAEHSQSVIICGLNIHMSLN